MHILSTFVLVVSVSIAQRASPQDDVPLRIESIRTPTARFVLKRAVRAALERLEEHECRKVLSDFRDASGRTIQERLDLLGETPRTFLMRIVFREGRDRRCRNPAILASSFIEGREIFICSKQFWETYREHPAYVEALLIHEIMHTLGLGENPPSSMEITARVLTRCWPKLARGVQRKRTQGR